MKDNICKICKKETNVNEVKLTTKLGLYADPGDYGTPHILKFKHKLWPLLHVISLLPLIKSTSTC